MAMENCPELVFVPWPVMGHVQLIEFAKLLICRKQDLSITVLVVKLPDYIDTVSGSFLDSLQGSGFSSRLNFFQLPATDPAPEWSSRNRGYFIHMLVESQKSNVRDFIQSRKASTVGLVFDMLCTHLVEIAEEYGIPSYVFCTSPASFVGAMLHFQTLQDDQNQDVPELDNSDADIQIPSFMVPVPQKVVSRVFLDKLNWFDRFLIYARGYRKAKGIIINSFAELEPHALNSFVSDSTYGRSRVPPVYPVGPVFNQRAHNHNDTSDAMKWLDNQPVSSVIFVCFGSQASLRAEQVKELAHGLERSGHRFLWSLRRPASKGSGAEFPSEYENYSQVLPEGFLDRTAEIGKVVGWIPQFELLSHQAIGGFVSHCGWNSVLESLWFGVPIATWPMHAEQQMNAFQLVRELGLAIEITLDYGEKSEVQPIVTAEKLEIGIRRLMESDSEVRKKVRDLRDKGRASIIPGGSSYESLGRLIQDMIDNVPS